MTDESDLTQRWTWADQPPEVQAKLAEIQAEARARVPAWTPETRAELRRAYQEARRVYDY